jgi:hypothetical protein
MKFYKYTHAIIILCLFLVVSCDPKKQEANSEEIRSEEMPESEKVETPPSDKNNKEVKSTKTASIVSQDTLVGKWSRPDGNYVIQIYAIKEDMKIEAHYFNPNPINISRAEIIEDPALRIFIEFDDRGYEGSSYDLKYDPQNDALVGKYFQATYGQTYQIGFIRMEE